MSRLRAAGSQMGLVLREGRRSGMLGFAGEVRIPAAKLASGGEKESSALAANHGSFDPTILLPCDAEDCPTRSHNPQHCRLHETAAPRLQCASAQPRLQRHAPRWHRAHLDTHGIETPATGAEYQDVARVNVCHYNIKTRSAKSHMLHVGTGHDVASFQALGHEQG